MLFVTKVIMIRLQKHYNRADFDLPFIEIDNRNQKQKQKTETRVLGTHASENRI